VRKEGGKLLQIATSKVHAHDRVSALKVKLMEEAMVAVQLEKDQLENTDEFQTTVSFNFVIVCRLMFNEFTPTHSEVQPTQRWR